MNSWMSDKLLELYQQSFDAVDFLFYKEIKFIFTFLKIYFHIKNFGVTSVCIINHNHNTVHFTKVAQKEAAI